MSFTEAAPRYHGGHLSMRKAKLELSSMSGEIFAKLPEMYSCLSFDAAVMTCAGWILALITGVLLYHGNYVYTGLLGSAYESSGAITFTGVVTTALLDMYWALFSRTHIVWHSKPFPRLLSFKRMWHASARFRFMAHHLILFGVKLYLNVAVLACSVLSIVEHIIPAISTDSMRGRVKIVFVPTGYIIVISATISILIYNVCFVINCNRIYSTFTNSELPNSVTDTSTAQSGRNALRGAFHTHPDMKHLVQFPHDTLGIELELSEDQCMRSCFKSEL